MEEDRTEGGERRLKPETVLWRARAGMLRWKGRNRTRAPMAGGAEERGLGWIRCGDHQVTKEASVLWSGWAGNCDWRLKHRGTIWKWSIYRDLEDVLGRGERCIFLGNWERAQGLRAWRASRDLEDCGDLVEIKP